MIYLANRRDSLRSNNVTKIQLFSNLPNVEVTVNGKAYSAKQGVNSKHWVIENVQLQKGENKIQASGKNGNTELTDEMIWTLQ